MAKCDCCGKGVSFGIQVSHSHRRSNRTWKPNVKRVKAIVDGSPKYIYACTRCLRSGKVTRDPPVSLEAGFFVAKRKLPEAVRFGQFFYFQARAAFKASALSHFSQGRPRSSLPIWP